MSEREDEMTRAINERAKNMLNNGGEKQVIEKGKSYADFKAQQVKKATVENPRDFANTLSKESIRQGKQSTQQNPAPAPTQSQNTQETISETPNRKTITFAAYGGFWVRLAAAILEKIILSIGAIPVISTILFVQLDPNSDYKSILETISEIDILTWLVFVVALVVVLLVYGYNIYLYFKYGTSIGYKIFGLRVISEKTGEKPTTGALWGRFGLKALLTWIPYLSFFGYLVTGGMIAWSSKKQGPHDMAAGTLVVAKKKTSGGLIAVLVVLAIIPIIGIIAGILFVAIDPATHVKDANNASLQIKLSTYNTEASLYYIDNYESYEGFCDNLVLEDEFYCSSSNTLWAIKSNSKAGEILCVDSSSYGVKKLELGHDIYENNSCTANQEVIENYIEEDIKIEEKVSRE